MQVKVVAKKWYSGVSLFDVKNFLRIDEDNDSDDATLLRMIKSSIDLIEKRCHFALDETTLDVYFEEYDIDNGTVNLPVYPISEIVKAYVISSDGIQTESEYTYKGLGEGSVYISGLIETDTIKIQYKAGYGITGKTELPPEIVKEIIITQVSNWYENRNDYVPVLDTKIKRLVDTISFASWI